MLTVEIPQVILDSDKATGIFRDIRITTYGSYPCDWAGGRNLFSRGEGFTYTQENQHVYTPGAPESAMRDEMKDYMRMVAREFNFRGVPFYVAMTNILPEPTDDEEEAFAFLDVLAGDPANGVITAHPDIHRAIKTRYGKNLTHISSVIRYPLEPGVDLDRLFDEFDLVVLRPETIKDDPESIPEEHRDRSIVIANYNCVRDCPRFRAHQDDISRKNKGGWNPGTNSTKVECSGYTMEFLMKPPDVQALLDMGFTTFKLGRFELMHDYTGFLFPRLKPVLKRGTSPVVDYKDGKLVLV